MSSATDVSVVVIGRNEGQRLERCFASIAKLSPAMQLREVIYVDSGSTDSSLEAAARAGATAVSLVTARPTAAMGRNAGWRRASAPIILFLDGDTELAPGFIAAGLSRFADPSIGVVWGHRRELHPEASVYNRVLDLDWIYPPGPAQFCGGDALFRRSVLEETGGFDDSLIAGEEPELCRRILARGSVVLHIDTPMTAHDLAITRFSQYWRRAQRAGHAYAEVSDRFAETDMAFWSAEVKRNRRHALVLLALPAICLIGSAAIHSWWPILCGFVLFCASVLRTAWKARWKSRSTVTLLLYAVHSHVQQIPIFTGQLRFLLSRRKGKREALLEYKQP